MKILIVGRFFPPCNNPRSNRTFELAKELARTGHDVTVYSLLGDYAYSEMEKEYGLTIRNYGPSKWGQEDSTGHVHVRKTLLYRISGYVIPNMKFWSEMEVSFLIRKKIHRIDQYDLIISVSHPFWTHFGICLLRKKYKDFPVWISDCGDPFSGSPFIKSSRLFIRIEKWWSRMTDYITIPIEQAKAAYLPDSQSKLRVIPQGFNLEHIQLREYKPNPVPTFIYAGTFYEGLRDPRQLLDYLSTLKSDFCFKIFSKNPKIITPYIDKLGHKISVKGYLPREELLRELSSADFLVNIKNFGTVQSPSKLIDYSLSKRPILSISSDFNSQEQQMFSEFLNGDYRHQDEPLNISEYDIRNVADKFIALYKEATAARKVVTTK